MPDLTLSRRLTLAASVLLLASGAAQADTLFDLIGLVRDGKPLEAYTLGAAHPELLGTQEFDFHFGVAAIDAGHSAEGVLALERFLLLAPGNHQARLELARGYFVLGEDARAREEFEAVLALEPPEAVVANVQRYLDAIRSREARYQTTARGYVEVGVGLDSNINGGVSAQSITLPVLGKVVVGNASVQQGDMVQTLGAGAQVTHPVAPGVMLFGGADFSRREMRLRDAYDTDGMSAYGGGAWILGDHQLRATWSYSTTLVDHARYRNVTGLGGEWQHQLNEFDTLSAGLQYAEMRHLGANAVRDADVSGAIVGFRRALPLEWQPVLSASLTMADENNRKNRNDLGRMLYAGRVGVTASPSANWGLSAAYTYQDSRYQDKDPLLGVQRMDRYNSVDLAATYLIDRQWSLRTELSFSDNASNIALYKYRRDAIGVKLRYEFK